MYGAITNAMKFRHYLILLSCATTLLGSFLQPLAGSLIQLTQIPRTVKGTLHVIYPLGRLTPPYRNQYPKHESHRPGPRCGRVKRLSGRCRGGLYSSIYIMSFLTSSNPGQFAEAAVFNGLSDPPFIFEFWSLAEFLVGPDDSI
jgi:hypothetical protein